MKQNRWKKILVSIYIFLPTIMTQAIFNTAYAGAWTSITTFDDHTAAIKPDGSLWAWGLNRWGALGIGNNVNQDAPIQIGTDTDWLVADTGVDHTLAIKIDGTLWVWGRNNSGEFGDGTGSGESNVPLQVGTDSDWVSVSAGDEFSVAMRKDGSLWAWGGNRGQLGISSSDNQYSPVQVGTDTDWVAVSVGSVFVIAQKLDGSLWSWGDDAYGQLGDGTPSFSNITRPLPGPVNADTDWLAFETGFTHVLAIKADGSLWAWGHNRLGQLGDGDNLDKDIPQRVGLDNNWVTVSGGRGFSLALRTDGTLWGAGRNDDGQLGDGTTVNKSAFLQAGTDTDWAAISAGDHHSVLLKQDGSAWAMGERFDGALGDGLTTVFTQDTPRRVGSDNDWASLTPRIAVAIKTDGTLWGWGTNINLLNDPILGFFHHTPTRVGNQRDWQIISTDNGSNALAIKIDGSLWGWGKNKRGQLWTGSGKPIRIPIRIGLDVDWTQVELGGNGYAVARKLDGTLWVWGSGLNNTPTLFSKGNWQTSGFIHGIKKDGTLWLLGTPSVQVGMDSDWVSLWDGPGTSYALKVDGSLWQLSWDWNLDVANIRTLGTAMQTAPPTQLGTDRDFLKVAGSQLVLKEDGTLWQLGIPLLRIGTDDDWVDIAVGESNYALKADGSLWSWGEESGSSGSLGYGVAWSTVPVLVITPGGGVIDNDVNSSSDVDDN